MEIKLTVGTHEEYLIGKVDKWINPITEDYIKYLSKRYKLRRQDIPVKLNNDEIIVDDAILCLIID